MNLKTAATIGVAIAVVIQSGSSQGEWENALKPKGKPGKAIAVVTAGKAGGGIQLPARPTPQEKKAAEDLQNCIREMTGATLEIVPGKGAPCRSASTSGTTT